jgi:hypothetical protein
MVDYGFMEGKVSPHVPLHPAFPLGYKLTEGYGFRISDKSL